MKFNNSLRNLFLATAALFSASFLVSCEDDNTTPPLDTSVFGVLSSNSQFNTLTTGIRSINGLQAQLQGTGPFTVFGPTNDAFNLIGVNAGNVAGVPNLGSILGYHVVAGNIPAASVPAGPNAKVTTSNGDSIFVTRDSRGVFINGIQVSQADLLASNGVVHALPAVLAAPRGNIVELALQDTTFRLLVQAVVKCNLQGLLSTAAPLTVFAPNNAAFRAAGFDSLAIANATPTTVTALTNVLAYHVITQRQFSVDLSEGEQFTMFNTGRTTVSLTGGAKIRGTSNPVASNIIRANIFARNGLIHVIDRVLLP
jgi:uncharacterized surface protein with fasciclin (FAS1) repeats